MPRPLGRGPSLRAAAKFRFFSAEAASLIEKNLLSGKRRIWQPPDRELTRFNLTHIPSSAPWRGPGG